jgi:hypothetical protein
MNQKKIQVQAKFAQETRFELRSNCAAPFCATQENEFERLKNRLLTQQLSRTVGVKFNAPLRRAANEAAALAWATVFPLLVFPLLFEEKSDVALRRAERQARIFVNSRELLAA